MESATHTYTHTHTHTHSVPVRALSECGFIEDLPLGASAWNAFALFLMFLSLLAMALLALKLAASMPKLGSRTCSNLRQTCSNRCLEIRKSLQNLIWPSLDEEVAELAKQKLLKLMDGFLKAIIFLLMVNAAILLRSASWVPMMRLEAEASEVYATVTRLGFNLPTMVPPMVFLQFPRTRTERNIHRYSCICI